MRETYAEKRNGWLLTNCWPEETQDEDELRLLEAKQIDLIDDLLSSRLGC